VTITISALQAFLGIGIMAATLVGAVVSAYVSLTHRGVDKATTDQITLDVDQRQEERHAWRYERMLQLEEYADQTGVYQRKDQDWHREITAILREARDAGYIPKDRSIPDPPVPPILPPPPARNAAKK
jgi:hypothetical protein